MSVLVNKDSKVIVQGFTGTEGTFHATQMIEGVNVCGKTGTAQNPHGKNHSLFVAFAPRENPRIAIAVVVENYLQGKTTRLIGPNCPGVITADEAKVGIMPGFIFKPGRVGIVSKSGTLTYEAADQSVKAGLGISTAIGIGGDPIIGTTTKEAVELLMNDPETDGIIMIGEIGGGMEAEAAHWIKEHGTKPVVGFIAGQTAPPGRRMGHAGAIVGGADDTAAAKMKILDECGVHVVASPADIGTKMAEALSKM